MKWHLFQLVLKGHIKGNHSVMLHEDARTELTVFLLFSYILNAFIFTLVPRVQVNSAATTPLAT